MAISPTSVARVAGDPLAPAGLHARILAWAFTLFSSARVVAYVPTIWALWQSGDSRQHSLFTWITWTGANATMALWLWEQNGRRPSRAVVVNLCNAVMCAATLVLIVALRL
ncbi:hypothetical protein ACFPPF_09750 [Xenophilus aerolatus]|nr:hypothetical protein [Xenophilus aerolatus]